MRKKVPKLNLNLSQVLVCVLMLFSVTSVVANNSPEKSDSNPTIKQERTIRGTVVDATGVPILGANVLEVGTTNGIATDFDGNFELKLITTQPKIKISYVGYITKEIVITPNQNIYKITLLEDAEALEEVVLVGFGEQKKASVVGAVTAINPKELQTPSSSLTQSFAGRLSGVIAVQRSGEPGADAAQFWIRGISTFGNNDPLIFLDGIEISLSDLNSVDPINIQNFSILKDASATAIYGARGANGVILVETKRGIIGKPKVNVTLENSFMSPTTYPEFADGVTFMNMFNEARRNQNPFAPPVYSDDKIQGTAQGLDPYVFPNVDWMDAMFSDFSVRKYANLNVRGGSEAARYFMSASVYHDKGILTETNLYDFDSNINSKRFNFVNNVSVNITPTTELELNLNADFIDYNGPSTNAKDIFTSVMNANPVNFPTVFPKPEGAGHVYYGNKFGGVNSGVFVNPYAELTEGYKERFNSTFISAFRIKQDFSFVAKGLSANALLSFKNFTKTQTVRRYNPYYYEIDSNGYAFDPATNTYNYNLDELVTGTESLTQVASNDGNRSMMLQASVNYARTFAKHDIGGQIVYLQRQFNKNLVSKDITASLPSRNQGVSGRVTYAYDDRYLFEANFGYTGSENFIKGKRFGFFPAAAVGYIISNENYFKGLKNTISLLKLRASYGESGNDKIYYEGEIERFPYTSEVNLSGGKGFTFGQNFDNSRSGVVINRYANDNITWEVGTKLNLGLDIELFDKLLMNFDVFKEERNGIFLERQTIPGTIGIGVTTPFANLGKVENKGLEAALSYNHAVNKDFIITSRGTFTFAQNKILERDEPNQLYPYRSRIGKPVNQLWGLQAERLFIDQAEIDGSPRQTFISTYAPGDIKYTDISNSIDGQNQIDANDQVPMGHPSVPEITYGFGVNVQYKKFDFGVLFQGIARVSFFMRNLQPFALNQRNVLQAIANDYWNEDNQNLYAFYPRLSENENPNNTQNSSWWLRDGDFLRLKNAEFGFQYNKNIRFYINGINLVTFSKFDLWDPEIGGANSGNGLGYPPQTTVNLGAQIKL